MRSFVAFLVLAFVCACDPPDKIQGQIVQFTSDQYGSVTVIYMDPTGYLKAQPYATGSNVLLRVNQDSDDVVPDSGDSFRIEKTDERVYTMYLGDKLASAPKTIEEILSEPTTPSSL